MLFAELGGDRIGRRTAVAGDVGGDTLAHLALTRRVPEGGEVGVGVDVDESGCHDQAADIDDAIGRGAEV